MRGETHTHTAGLYIYIYSSQEYSVSGAILNPSAVPVLSGIIDQSVDERASERERV